MDHGRIEILERYQDVVPFLGHVSAAADANRNSLGFLAASVYGEFARQGNLYVAVFVDLDGKLDAAPRYAGHLLVAGRLPRARIVQIFADPEFRRRGLATHLVAHAKAALTQAGYISIAARVADDLPIANLFWQQQGFYVQSIQQGGVTSERTILVRSHELPSPQLFPMSGIDAANPLGLMALAPNDVPLFLLDLNVLFDFSPRRLRRDQASAIIQAERMNFCRVAVSDEIQRELLRTAVPGRTDPMEAFVALFPTFPLANGGDSGPLIRELAALIFPAIAFDTLSERALSDLRHVATARQNQLAGLITSDTAILCAAAGIWERYAVQILSPEAFTLEGSGTITTAVQNSARSTLVLKELQPEDTLAVNQLLSKLEMSGSEIAGGWLPTRSEARISVRRAVWQGTSLLGFSLTPAVKLAGVWTLRIAVDEHQPEVRDAARALLVDYFEMPSREWPQNIQLHLAPNQSIGREVASDFGFSGTADRLILRKVALGQILTVSNWSIARESLRHGANLTLPERPPRFKFPEQHIELLTSDGNRNFVMLHDLERLLSPALFCLPDRPAVIAPIRREFAQKLLRHLRQTSWLPEHTSSLFHERHYLSDPRTLKLMNCGTLILFYESMSGGGSGEIVAIARIVRSYLKATAALESVDLLQSVLTPETVMAIGDAPMKTVTAFDNVFVLPHPVTRRKLQKFDCGDPNDLITTRSISDLQLRAILKEALAHAYG